MKCDLQGHLKSLQTAWLLLSVCPGTADLVAHYYCSHAQRAPRGAGGAGHALHDQGCLLPVFPPFLHMETSPAGPAILPQNLRETYKAWMELL